MKLCIEADHDPTNPEDLGYSIPTEYELAQDLSFILKQVTMFDSRAWSVARGGGVGSIASIVHYYVNEKKSLAPWITDAIQSLTRICSLLFEAAKSGRREKITLCGWIQIE